MPPFHRTPTTIPTSQAHTVRPTPQIPLPQPHRTQKRNRRKRRRRLQRRRRSLNTLKSPHLNPQPQHCFPPPTTPNSYTHSASKKAYASPKLGKRKTSHRYTPTPDPQATKYNLTTSCAHKHGKAQFSMSPPTPPQHLTPTMSWSKLLWQSREEPSHPSHRSPGTQEH